jgi:hypothetical protein
MSRESSLGDDEDELQAVPAIITAIAVINLNKLGLPTWALDHL